jgi:glucosylglycerate synthase
LPEEKFAYPADLWARTVYEFSAAYHKAVIGRDHVVQALVPLFRGRAYTFLTETREASAEEVENHIESLCRTFDSEKPYLAEVWDERK